MQEKSIDSNAGGFLILLLPIAFVIVFLFTTWPVLLALAVLSISLNVWQRYQWQKWSQQVNPIFHQLIQANRGCVSPLDLAMKANFSAEVAKRYLDTKAEEFGAQRRKDEAQGPVYYFITASTLGGIFDDSEPPSQPQNEALASIAQERAERAGGALSGAGEAGEAEGAEEVEIPQHKQPPSASLIQSELAKRFDVHSSTVYKRRADPDFSEWSRSRDPEGIAWKYSPETREFVPLEGVRDKR